MFVRWRSHQSFDLRQVLWVVSAWAPLVLWAGLSAMWKVDVFVIVLFLFGAIGTGHFLLIYICNFHVLSHLLLIYICKLHWNLNTMFV